MTKLEERQPRDRPEEAWYRSSADQRLALRRWLARHDQRQDVINGLIGWLDSRDCWTASTATQARYRKLLRQYGSPRQPRGNGRAAPQRRRPSSKNADNPRGVSYVKSALALVA